LLWREDWISVTKNVADETHSALTKRIGQITLIRIVVAR